MSTSEESSSKIENEPEMKTRYCGAEYMSTRIYSAKFAPYLPYFIIFLFFIMLFFINFRFHCCISRAFKLPPRPFIFKVLNRTKSRLIRKSPHIKYDHSRKEDIFTQPEAIYSTDQIQELINKIQDQNKKTQNANFNN